MFDTAAGIGIAVADHLDYRQNIIVPNVRHGLRFLYEIDLLVCAPSRYLWEVEIKVSVSDLKRDQQKRKWFRYSHQNRISRLYFAVPEKLRGSSEYVPDFAGILVVGATGRVGVTRKPKVFADARRATEPEVQTLLELGVMRTLTATLL